MANTLSQSELDEFNVRQQDMMNNLTKLQNMELDLYKELEAKVSSGGTTAEKDLLVSRIQTLSDTRMDMYRDLMDNYEIIRQSVGQTRGDLVDQLALIDIVQQQLDSLRMQAGNLSSIKTGKERMIEINTYYGKKYMAQKELMQIIILTCVPLLILSLLTKFGKIATNISIMIGAVVLIIGAYYTVMKLIDINRRSKLVFDEYDWGGAPPTGDLDAGAGAGAGASMSGFGIGSCIGQHCCSPGMIYNSELNKCEVETRWEDKDSINYMYGMVNEGAGQSNKNFKFLGKVDSLEQCKQKSLEDKTNKYQNVVYHKPSFGEPWAKACYGNIKGMSNNPQSMNNVVSSLLL